MYGKCGLFFTSYRQESQFFQTWTTRVWFGLFMLFLLICPMFLGIAHLTVLSLICISVIAAVSLNLLTGGCGQISLGHGAFVGVGAYATAYFVNHGVPAVPAMALAGLVTAVVGLFFGIPSLRLKGLYLAIATLAAQIILEYVFINWEAVTNGADSVPVDPPSILGFVFDTKARMFYFCLVTCVILVTMAANLMRAKQGRAFVAIRDHYLSAEIVGVNLFAYKLQAFAVSSFMAGVAGGLWAFTYLSVSPGDTFGIKLSIQYLAMIIIGGLGSVQGAIFGAVFVTMLSMFILPGVAGWISSMYPAISMYVLAMQDGVFGLILMLFLIFEPEGLAHMWRLTKASWKLYPFAH